MIERITGIGLMSGTSLDGLDLAHCVFHTPEKTRHKWRYEILNASTINYDPIWRNKLINAPKLNAQDFWKLHVEYGHYLGNAIMEFCKAYKIKDVDFVASHGHTIFHQPQNKFTCQIGDGASIAAITNIKTICDFRSTDVALGGEGAPLVPIGDLMLFGEYESCLNIGGIANISFNCDGKRIAFDICPANIVFNYLAQKNKLEFDANGQMARNGEVNDSLLNKINDLDYYKIQGRRSLGREWIEDNFIALLEASSINLAEKMSTALEHCAIQVAGVLNENKLKNVLISGGGVYNSYLVERIQSKTTCEIIIPDKETIEFKEALIFAFLGLKRLLGEENCLQTVTGARRNSIAGAIYG